jgi:hypothetical protein
MINDAKGVMEFENAEGSSYSRTYSLSARGKNRGVPAETTVSSLQREINQGA